MGRSNRARPAAIAPASTPSLESVLQPRAWQGVAYRPLGGAEGDTARAIFSYAALWVPPASPGELGWGAWMAEEGREAEGGAGDDAREAEAHGRGEVREPMPAQQSGAAPARVPAESAAGAAPARVPAERLVGALLLEPHGEAGMIYGPVVVNHPDPFEVASQLLAATLRHATALGIGTLFTRPQGLDRVWVRFGFIPVPERELPKAFKARPGSGLFAWRGGSALWSSMGAGPRAGAAPASTLGAGPRAGASPNS